MFGTKAVAGSTSVVSSSRHLPVPSGAIYSNLMVSSQNNPKPQPKFVLFTQVYADDSEDPQPAPKNGDPIEDNDSDDEGDEVDQADTAQSGGKDPAETTDVHLPIPDPMIFDEMPPIPPQPVASLSSDGSPFKEVERHSHTVAGPQSSLASSTVGGFAPKTPRIPANILPPSVEFSPIHELAKHVEHPSVEQAREQAEEVDVSEEEDINILAVVPPSIQRASVLVIDEESDSSVSSKKSRSETESEVSRSSSSASSSSTSSSSLARLFDPKINNSTGALRSESVPAIPTAVVPPEALAVARAQSVSALLSPNSRKRHLEQFDQNLVKETEEKAEKKELSLARAPAPGFLRDFWFKTWEARESEKVQKARKEAKSNHILKTRVLTEEDRKKMALESKQKIEAEVERKKQLAELSNHKHKKGNNELPNGQRKIVTFFHSSRSFSAASSSSLSSSSSSSVVFHK